ncbi:MAG TPA: response regulator [Oscillatoriaceae cyanobacterium]
MSDPILLVEDVEDNRELARFLLESEGYAVVEAHDGQEALERAGSQPFALVLMDLSLPVLDGWEAARRLRANPETAKLPIVALTAHAMSGDESRVLQAGFDGYIPKPIDLTSFAQTVAHFLNARR